MKLTKLEKPSWGGSYRPNETFDEDYVEMLLCTYHHDADSFLSKQDFQIQKLWDHYDFDDYLGYLKFSEDEIKELREKAFAEFMIKNNIIYDDVKDTPEGKYRLFWTIESASDATIYRLGGNIAKINIELEAWFEKARNDRYWASGDDSFFDYTPDELELFYQICCVTGNQELWDRFYKWAQKEWYNDDPEGTILCIGD